MFVFYATCYDTFIGFEGGNILQWRGDGRVTNEMIKELCNIGVDIMVIFGLLYATVTDIWKRKIWLPLFVVEIPVVLLMSCIADRGNSGVWIASIGGFCIFYLASVVTKGQVGKGDAFLFSLAGAGVGLLYGIILLYLTFFLAVMVVGIVMAWRRVRKNDTIPLAPFITIAYGMIVWIRYSC